MANKRTLRDAVGRILGYLEDKDNKTYLYNVVRRELGYYDKKMNQTWQTYPIKKLISREGDILTTLLESEKNE